MEKIKFEKKRDLKVDPKHVVEDIRKQLKTSGWADELYLFLSSMEFEQLIVELIEMAKNGTYFTPKLDVAFRWLHCLKVEKVKAVMLIDHSSSILNRCDGIPLSCSNAINPDPLLASIFKSLRTNGSRYENEEKTDLVRWCKQGVLMIPLSLTARINGKPNYSTWAPFIVYIISKIGEKYPDIPWVLAGKRCWEYEEMIDSRYIFKNTLLPIPDINEGLLGINWVLEEKMKIIGINW